MKRNKIIFHTFKYIGFVPLIIGSLTVLSCSNSSSLKNRLLALPSVFKVNKLENNNIKSFKEIYEIYFNEYIDPNNPNTGTFPLKIHLFYNGDNLINEYHVNGYFLKSINEYKDGFFGPLFSRYQGNFINLEYRFFGSSVPSDMTYSGTKYFSYLTSKNACYDFHNIINSLSNILKGKRYLSGGSKGGFTTETMAYYYPLDFNAYLSECAPLCSSIYDTRIYDNLYHSIGDLHYGKEKAQEYRDLMLEFTRVCFSETFRNLIMVLTLDFKKEDNKTLKPLSYDEIYEANVSECVTLTWQYYQDFSSIKSCLDLPQTTSDEINYKSYKLSEIINFTNDGKKSIYIECPFTPYDIQSHLEMGNFALDFSYLREKGINVKTLPEKDKHLMELTTLTTNQINTFTYSDKLRNELINFFNTTKDVELVKLYGLSDLWYAVRAPQIVNDHVHVYEGKASHFININNLEESDRNSVYEIFDKCLY